VSLKASLTELLFPVRCIACSALGLKLCSQCRLSWIAHIYTTTHRGVRPFTIYSAVRYSSIAKKILISSKEQGIERADSLIIEALDHSLRYALARDWADFLIPIPSRKSITRQRGRSYISDLTKELSQESSIPVADVLIHTRKIRDQSGLHSVDRFRNLEGALEAQMAPRGRALIVDDLVTTGATLLEARRALEAEGIEVVGAITACIAQSVSHFSR